MPSGKYQRRPCMRTFGTIKRHSMAITLLWESGISQRCLGKMFSCSPRTIRRAISHFKSFTLVEEVVKNAL